MKRILTTLALCLIAVTSLRAQVIFYDALDYADGSIVTNSGGVWIHHSGTAGDALEINHRLEISQARTEDVHRWFDPAQTNGYLNGVLYASFLMKMTNLPANAGGTYFAHFMDTQVTNAGAGGTQFRGRVFALTANALPGTYRLGVANAAGDASATAGTGPNQVVPMDLALNLDYQVVLKYDLDNAVATLWVNPAFESEPGSGPSGDSGAVATPLTAFGFRQALGEGVSEIGNVLVGLSFADVVTNAAKIPVIGLQPVSVTNYAGNPASLTVLASGKGVLTYQWFKDGSPVSGATLNQYAVSQLQPSQQGTYYCAITNSAGGTNSATAYVSVNAAPTAPFFTLQPQSSTNGLTTTATFAAVALGTGPLSYQWNFNTSPLSDGTTPAGSTISGSTTPTLTVSGITLSDAGTYVLTVTGANGSTDSSNALLVVAPPVIAISSGNYSQNFDTLANTGSPFWVNGATLPGWYASQSSGSLTNYRSDAGSSTAGALYSYGASGSTERALGSIGSGTPANIAYGVRFTNDTTKIATNFTIAYTGEQWRNGGNTATQYLSFSYRVSGTAITSSDAGDTAVWTANPALNFATPTVGSTPGALDGNASANRTLIPAVLLTNLAVLPGQEVMFRWKDLNDAGNDHGVAVDDLTITFNTVNGAATPPAFTTQPLSRTNNAGTIATFTAGVSGAVPMTFQWLKNGSPISDGPTGTGSTNAGSTGPVLTIYNVLAADAGAYVLSASNSLSVTPTNSATAVLTVLDPVITTQPASISGFIGDNANFFVGAAGTPTLSFQWLSNGVPIAGATANTLNFQVTTQSSLAGYSVAVTGGAGGSVTSSVAAVVLVTARSARIATWDFNSNPADATVSTGTTTPTLGSGTASLLSSNSQTFAAGAFADPATTGTDNSGWNTTGYPAPGSGNKTGGVQFNLSTVGYKNLLVTWQQRNSATASKYGRVQYSTDGTTFVDSSTVTTMLNTNGDWVLFKSDLSSIAGVNNNPNFAFRIVTEFQSTATGSGVADYVPTVTGNYGTGGTIRFDWLNVFADPTSLVTPIPLGYQQNGANLVLRWTDSTFALQAAPEVTGVYTNIPGATSPYTNVISGPRRFFRLKATN